LSKKSLLCLLWFSCGWVDPHQSNPAQNGLYNMQDVSGFKKLLMTETV